jgi:hypothetical protein
MFGHFNHSVSPVVPRTMIRTATNHRPMSAHISSLAVGERSSMGSFISWYGNCFQNGIMSLTLCSSTGSSLIDENRTRSFQQSRAPLDDVRLSGCG